MIGCLDKRHPYLILDSLVDMIHPDNQQSVIDMKKVVVLRDVTVPQVIYSTSKKCPNQGISIDDCRCLCCVTLHTAKLPNIHKLEDDEIVIVICVERKKCHILRDTQ